ncbi:MAG: hypothetical protein H6492_01790 [Candidatus Paracaedibacteraceae bacterium]|nr:hypothetical protein [Candidatus Paracaedibacteraceae bacterium]
MSLINYDKLIKNSLKHVVKQALEHVAEKGLYGEQHFYITFQTDFPDVNIPEYLMQEYPDELTIVLENQFWNLKVFETYFTVSLNFNAHIESIQVPFDAILEFSDPSEDFVLQFELNENDLGVNLIDEPSDEDEENEHADQDSKVISLDLFRKK